MLLRPGGAVVWSVPEVWRHGAGGDPPPMPQCVGLSCRSPGGGAGCRLWRILQRPGYPTPARARRRFYTDLDKCPKPYKIAAPARARRHFWRILQKSTLVPRTYTREEAMLSEFWQVAPGCPHPHARGGDNASAEFCKSVCSPTHSKRSRMRSVSHNRLWLSG